MASAKEIFEELQKKFGYDGAITTKILDAGITSLSEFRYYCDTEAEVVANFVTPVQNLLQPKLQGARVKHAWASVVAAEKQREQQQAAGAQLDEEELLPAATLSQLRENFYKRYRFWVGPEQQPSDRVLTRLSRALQKRSLEVFNVMQVRSLADQRGNPAKKRKVAGNLYVSQGEDEEEPRESTWEAFRESHWMYLFGLAIVGATPMEPLPAQAEVLGSDSTNYVQFPFDLAWKYHHRLVQLGHKLSETTRMEYLMGLDRTERAEWAQRFSTQADKSLGQIVLEVLRQRDHHWAAPPPCRQQSALQGVWRPLPKPRQRRPPLQLRRCEMELPFAKLGSEVAAPINETENVPKANIVAPVSCRPGVCVGTQTMEHPAVAIAGGNPDPPAHLERILMVQFHQPPEMGGVQPISSGFVQKSSVAGIRSNRMPQMTTAPRNRFFSIF